MDHIKCLSLENANLTCLLCFYNQNNKRISSIVLYIASYNIQILLMVFSLINQTILMFIIVWEYPIWNIECVITCKAVSDSQTKIKYSNKPIANRLD
jgi:hypothetical protein